MKDNDLAKKLLDELVPHLEQLEAQNTAILQFLKENEIATEKQLAPYLDEAESASNVKWRATRLRVEYLLASSAIEKEKPVEGTLQKPPKAEGEEGKAAPPTVEAHAQQDEKRKLPDGRARGTASKAESRAAGCRERIYRHKD